MALLNMMPRAGWTHVRPDYDQMTFRDSAAQYVFYTHTAETAQCYVTDECCGQMYSAHVHEREA